MRTKADCKALYLRYLDSATKKGIAIPANKIADYVDKFNYFLNDAQLYMAQQVKIPAVQNITQNPITPLAGSTFDMQQYLPGTPIVFEVVGVKSYYIEMDNVGTCTININGSLFREINNTAKKIFTVYKSNTGALSTDTVTMTFSGSYPYNARNIGMFAYAFPLDTDVPDYTKHNVYDLNSDFLAFDTVINKTDLSVYKAYMNYKWENNKKIIFDYADAGSFDIHYFKKPTEILSTADDSTVMEIDDIAIDSVVLQAGIMATLADNPALSSLLRSLYTEKIQNLYVSDGTSDMSVQSMYDSAYQNTSAIKIKNLTGV
jgi:hypothetical protein